MANSRQRPRRRRKRRGTQAGTIKQSRNARSRGGSRSSSQSKMTNQERRQQRLERPPSWRTAITRSLFAAVLLFVVFALVISKNDIVGAAKFSIFAAVIYAPAFYYVDLFTYRRRQRQKQQQQGKNDS